MLQACFSQLKIDSTDSSVKDLLGGFKLALTALSQQKKFPIDSIKEESKINDRADDMLEGFLARKVFSASSKHDNLISFYRENDLMNCNSVLNNGKPCNQALNDIIIASLALTSFRLVEINLVMMEIINNKVIEESSIQKQLKEKDYLKYCQEADVAINLFLDEKGPSRKRCLKYGYGGTVRFALFDSEYKKIHKACITQTEEKFARQFNLVKSNLIEAYRGNTFYNNEEFINKVDQCQSLQALKKLYSESPGPYVPEVLSILSSALKELPSVVMEENTSALYYASKI